MPVLAKLDIARPAPFPRVRVAVPFFEGTVSAGFPSPADDHLQQPIDLNELLITDPPATFLVRASGVSMVLGKIHDGDLLVVNRAKTPQDRSIVMVSIDGDFTIKRLCKRRGRLWLQPENPEYPPIEFNETQDFVFWGVVTGAITQFS